MQFEAYRNKFEMRYIEHLNIFHQYSFNHSIQQICILRQKKMALMTIIYLLKGLPLENMYAIFRCTENEIECTSKF